MTGMTAAVSAAAFAAGMLFYRAVHGHYLRRAALTERRRLMDENRFLRKEYGCLLEENRALRETVRIQ